MKQAPAIITVVVGIIVVGIAAIVFGGGGDKSAGSGGGKAAVKAPKGSLAITLVTSPEKQKLLEASAGRFNAEGKTVGGKKIFVTIKSMNSGDAEALLVKGQLEADVWSPASKFWGQLANLQADKKLTDPESPSAVRSPLVIGMWEKQAKALGWPKKAISFKQLTELATASNGWASVGAPAYGKFKYVHTNPDSSTSGAEAVAASYFAAAGKREGLTVADVAKASPQVKRLERAIVHYGSDTLFISDQLCKGGPAYASAVAMEETTLLDFNKRTNCQTSGDRLVALYPSEGSFYSDSPLFTLATGGEKAQAAAELTKFLQSDITAERAGEFGFRPGKGDKAAGLVDKSNGVDPAQPKRTLEVPTPVVLDKILAQWRADRKPARVQVVLDNSGSMNDENKLVKAKDGLKGFFNELAPQDEVGLTKFSSSVDVLVEPAPYRGNKQQLMTSLDQIIPEADTAVRDATLQSVEKIKALADADHINAIVVLTDGEDTVSGASTQRVVDAIKAANTGEGTSVRVFTIAYGSAPDDTELKKFAEAGDGKAFKANTDDIAKVYKAISSYF